MKHRTHWKKFAGLLIGEIEAFVASLLGLTNQWLYITIIITTVLFYAAEWLTNGQEIELKAGLNGIEMKIDNKSDEHIDKPQ